MAQCVLEITAHAIDRLDQIGASIHSPRDDKQRSGIVTFDLPGKDPQKVRKHCLERGVALACRDGKLRISPHAYNTQDDVDRLISALME